MPNAIFASPPPTRTSSQRRRWSLSEIDMKHHRLFVPSPGLQEEGNLFPHEEHWQEGGSSRPSRWRKLGAAIVKTLGAVHSPGVRSPQPGTEDSHGGGGGGGGGGGSGGRHYHHEHRHRGNHRGGNHDHPSPPGARQRDRSNSCSADERGGHFRSPRDLHRMDWDNDSRGEYDVESIASELCPPPFMVLHAKPEATIAAGLTLKGELKFKSFLRVDGRLEGQVVCTAGSSGCLLVGPEGVLVGDVRGISEVMVEGRLEGDISAATVLLK
ncbi:unnamed protein product, partial [Phaeothamnion confervicola]